MELQIYWAVWSMAARIVEFLPPPKHTEKISGGERRCSYRECGVCVACGRGADGKKGGRAEIGEKQGRNKEYSK